MDWILMTVARHRDGEYLRELSGISKADKTNGLFDNDALFELNFVNIRRKITKTSKRQCRE